MYDQNAVKIYTDGSARPNPGKGGVGMVVVYPDEMEIDNFELSEGYIMSTNNRMELRAVIYAFEWLQSEMKIRRFTRAIIITDSEYVQSNYTNVNYWKADGWNNKYGKPYENIDLWDTFLKERQKTKISHDIVWSKGKQNEVLKRVDTLAKLGSAHPIKTDYGFNPGKFTATRTKSNKAPILFPARGQSITIRIYRKSLYGRNDKKVYKVTFDFYDEVVKNYTEKYVAYLDKDCPDLKRNNCYIVTFDKNLNFPKILQAERVEYKKVLTI